MTCFILIIENEGALEISHFMEKHVPGLTKFAISLEKNDICNLFLDPSFQKTTMKIANAKMDSLK